MNYIPLKVFEDGSPISKEEALWLYERAKSMSSIVEIGSYKGRSTHALLSGCPGKVWAVDHFKGSVDTGDATYGKNGKNDFLENVGHFPNLILLEMSSKEAASQFEDKLIDMVFIDAGHLYEEILEDLKLWLPKTKVLICGHDIHHDGVVRAIVETFNKRWEHSIGSMWEHMI